MLKSARIIPYIPASDVARARSFYEEKVGLTPKEEYAGGVTYECGLSCSGMAIECSAMRSSLTSNE